MQGRAGGYATLPEVTGNCLPCRYNVCPVAKKRLNPSEAELEVLRILWAEGGLTAMEIHHRLGKTRRVARTTLLTRLQHMLDKGIIHRDDRSFPQRFDAVVDEGGTTGGLVHEFLRRVFGGSTKRLLLHLLASKKASAKELREIRRQIRELEEK